MTSKLLWAAIALAILGTTTIVLKNEPQSAYGCDRRKVDDGC